KDNGVRTSDLITVRMFTMTANTKVICKRIFWLIVVTAINFIYCFAAIHLPVNLFRDMYAVRAVLLHLHIILSRRCVPALNSFIFAVSVWSVCATVFTYNIPFS